jgi:hypothetical protein
LRNHGARAGGEGQPVTAALAQRAGDRGRQPGRKFSAAFDEVFAGNGRQTIMAAAWLPPDDTVCGTDQPSEREAPVQRE